LVYVEIVVYEVVAIWGCMNDAREEGEGRKGGIPPHRRRACGGSKGKESGFLATGRSVGRG
jgi:hypothetical protein